MNVYDFDGTIYRGDSSVDFFRFVLRRKPAIIGKLPGIAKDSVRYALGKIDKTALKERFFSFLSLLDGDEYVRRFWEKHKKNINPWYPAQQREDDVVISASPAFLLVPLCEEMGIKYLIASDVDIRTGKFRSPNCRGEEKVRLFRERFPDRRIERFYSDSAADLPLAREAEQAFLVKNGRITDRPFPG